VSKSNSYFGSLLTAGNKGFGETDMNRYGSHQNHENGHDSPWDTTIQDEKMIAFSY
jgi:hypothetical protein